MKTIKTKQNKTLQVQCCVCKHGFPRKSSKVALQFAATAAQMVFRPLCRFSFHGKKPTAPGPPVADRPWQACMPESWQNGDTPKRTPTKSSGQQARKEIALGRGQVWRGAHSGRRLGYDGANATRLCQDCLSRNNTEKRKGENR